MSGIDFDEIEPMRSSGTPDRDEVRAMIQEEILRFARCLVECGNLNPRNLARAVEAYREGRNRT